MALIFNADTGLLAQDAETIRANVATDWKQAFNNGDNMPKLNTEPETPAGQLIDGLTAIILDKDNQVLQLANMFDPAKAVGVWQDALAAIYFIRRRISQSTAVTCLCRGLMGTVIPVGSVVQDANGYQYASIAAATIGTDGTANVIFYCTEQGAISAESGVVNKIITVIPGWDSVTNTAAGVIGRLRESQSEFEQRRYNSVAQNSHGLAASVEGVINNLQDVIACRIEQNRSNSNITVLGVQIPPHSVYLSVYGGTAEEIGNIMHNKLDAGCGTAGNTLVTVTDPTNGSLNDYYYTVPTLSEVYVKVTTESGANYIPASVQQAIIDNFTGNADNFRLKMGDTVYASRFYQSVLDAGLTQLIKIELSLDGVTYSDNISFNLNQMPSIAANDITFVEVTE